MVLTIATTPPSSLASPQRMATWDQYVKLRDQYELDSNDRSRLFFNSGFLWVKAMGWEGLNHARVNNLFTLLLGLWLMAHPEQTADCLGGCLLEKAGLQAASPDLVVYVGDNIPQWQPGTPRRIDLNIWRVPDLVGEVADTTLAIDLDEMKQLYAALGIPEYWVIDVQGQRVLIFQLRSGHYEQSSQSQALTGLTAELLESTLAKLQNGTNIIAANWFMQQLSIG